MDNKNIAVSAVVLLLLVLLSGCVSKEDTNIWCNSSQISNDYVVKGITNYEDRQVCEVIITTNNGSTTQFFNKDGSYMIMIYKDKNGNVLKEINVSK